MSILDLLFSTIEPNRRNVGRSLKLVALVMCFAFQPVLNQVFGHTTSDFLPLQFTGYHAPFGFDETEFYTEVWGSGDFAYLGSVSSGVAIVDVRDPASISTAAVFGGSLGVAFSDIHVAGNTGYFSSDSEGTYIVDLSDPTSPSSMAQVSALNGGFDSVTNTAVTPNYLFQVSESSSEIAVFDILDPASPSFITRIETNDSIGVFDLSVQGSRIYVAGLGGEAGEGAVYVYDVSNLDAGTAPLIGQLATGSNTASAVPTADHSKLIVTHRETGGELAAWNISNLSTAVEIESVDASDLGVNAFSTATTVVLDSIAYVAWHQAGVQVIDLNLLDETDTIFRTGAFGTSRASPLDGFVGNTSVHPMDHGRVLLSDSRWGLYVVDATNVVSLPGDFNEDGTVDVDDIDFYSGKIGLTSSDVDFDARLDFDEDDTIEVEEHNYLVNNFVKTSNGVSGALLGDVNLDGNVDVLNDAFLLVGQLNSLGPYSYGTADLNADQQVDVLGDAFILIGNLGQSTDAVESGPTSSSEP